MRYDKRYIPHNTWLFVKVDGRDISEALIFFTKYYVDKEFVEKLIKYTYYESPETAHEWLTWRRALHQYAQLLFQ